MEDAVLVHLFTEKLVQNRIRVRHEPPIHSSTAPMSRLWSILYLPTVTYYISLLVQFLHAPQITLSTDPVSCGSEIVISRPCGSEIAKRDIRDGLQEVQMWYKLDQDTFRLIGKVHLSHSRLYFHFSTTQTPLFTTCSMH